MTEQLWTGPRSAPRRYRVDVVDGQPVAEPGSGGDGLVYRAFSDYRSSDGTVRMVALKLKLHFRLSDATELERRVDILRLLDDPHLMRAVDAFVGSALTPDDVIYDLVHEDYDLCWVVTEWVEGPRLSDVPTKTPLEALSIAAQVARAVDAMHRTRSKGTPEGIIHRDLKASNVKLTPDGDAVLIDYGSAGPAGEEWVRDGTPGWLAPEVSLGGSGSAAGDRWGVGAIAHCALVGQPPPLDGAACSAERIRTVLNAAPPGDAPSDKEAAAAHVARLLESDPAARPTDLGRWADELDGLATSRRRRLATRTIVRSSAAVAVAVALIAAYVAAWNHPTVADRAATTDSLISRACGIEANATWDREGRRLADAVAALNDTTCVDGLERVADARVALLVDDNGRAAGAMIASPEGSLVRLTKAEYQSYRSIAGAGRTADVARFGGYPTAAHHHTDPPATIVELSKGGLLVGHRADEPMYWIPQQVRPLWEREGGLAGTFGFPTSNPFRSGDVVRIEFEHCYVTASSPAAPTSKAHWLQFSAADVAVHPGG